MVFDPVKSGISTYIGLSNHFEGKKAREEDRIRQAKLDEMAEERHDAQLVGLSEQSKHRDRMYESQRESHLDQRNHRDKLFDREEQRYQDGAGLRDLERQNAQKRSKLYDVQTSGAGITNEMRMLELDETKAQQLQRDTFNQQKEVYYQYKSWENLMRGGLTPEKEKYLALNPHLDMRYMTSDKVLEAGHDFESLISSGLPKNELFKHPKFLDAVSVLGRDLIVGSQGKATKISAIRQGDNPDEIIVGLQIEGDDTERPVTVNRSSDDNDLVKKFSLSQLNKQFMSRIRFSREGSTAIGRQQYMSDLENEYGDLLNRDKTKDYTSEANKSARAIYNSQTESGITPGTDQYRSFDDIYTEVKSTLDGSGWKPSQEAVSNDQAQGGYRRPSKEGFKAYYRGEISERQYLKNFGQAELERANAQKIEVDKKSPASTVSDAEQLSNLGITDQAQAEARLAEIDQQLSSYQTARGRRGDRNEINALIEQKELIERAIMPGSEGRGRSAGREAGSLYGVESNTATAQN